MVHKGLTRLSDEALAEDIRSGMSAEEEDDVESVAMLPNGASAGGGTVWLMQEVQGSQEAEPRLVNNIKYYRRKREGEVAVSAIVERLIVDM